MFGYSIIQMARRNGHKIDKEVRNELVKTYEPFRNVPCFLHRPMESILKTFKKMSVIIEFEEDSFQLGIQDVKNRKCDIPHEYDIISCCSANVSIKQLEDILDNCQYIKQVYFDRDVQALLDHATPSIHSDTLQQSGLTGKNTTIAVIDTGIYPHQDLEGRITGFADFVNNRTDPYDDNGHGTHCAGDAAANGASSGGQFRGPAPDANVVGVKVLDKRGSGSLSAVIAGIQWCIQNRDTLDIDILSLSLGFDSTLSHANDPVVRAVEVAWDHGIVVCAAAGNSGPSQGTIASPGVSPKIVTVGATHDFNTVDRRDDTIAVFSSRGPTVDGVTKPDLVTPGTNIISLRSPGSYLDRNNPYSRVGNGYMSSSGTSMATPICAGVVAQLLQKHPKLTPDQVKTRLIEACEDMGVPAHAQGHGYLNAERLVTQ